MSDIWSISKARHADCEAIASLFAMSWTSPFSRLQFGDSDPQALSAALAPRIALQLQRRDVSFYVIRSIVTSQVLAVAQWTLPADERWPEQETQEEQDERQAMEDEAYRKNLPENSNKDLIMDFTIGVRSLRDRIAQGQRYYLLDNLATDPDYRGQGLATKLIKRMLARADEYNVPVYLETASDNPARRVYEGLGFEERGSYTIDLSKFATEEELEKCGGVRTHTHVAFVRQN